MTQYTIEIYYSPCTLPISYFWHTWIIISSPEYGVNRYEVHWFKNKIDKTYVHKNRTAKEVGVTILPFTITWRFKGKLLYKKEGLELKDVILSLEKKLENYPYKNSYHMFFGPNSNTLTKWCLLQIKDKDNKKIKLPFQAWSGFFGQ